MTTYGVGAIVPVEDESYMIAGIDRWNVGAAEEIHEPRLERQLAVYRFCLPPSGRAGGDVPVVRFPTWESCPTCHRLASHNFFCGPSENRCNLCGTELVPSRFVAACKNGHIEDFPYFAWVHAGLPKSTATRHDLSIKATGTSASLKDVVINCDCGAPPKSLEGAFAERALKTLARCQGTRPWLEDSTGECNEALRTLQRGASNVYFGIQRSALSIPPWSEEGYKLLSSVWSTVKHIPRDSLHAVFQGRLGTSWKGAGVTADELAQLAFDRLDQESSPTTGEQPTIDDLRAQEYDALSRGKQDSAERQDFVAVTAPDQGSEVMAWFDQVMLVKRLREVRVLESFTRLLPYTPGEPEERKASLFRDDPGWRPAIEVVGEGVFLRLKLDPLERWEHQPQVEDRARKINDNLTNRFALLGLAPTQRITPRMLLVHSLAHALINQWSLDCGYPTASLRERLYVSEHMAGLLIYTATTDSAGSLGGVVAQAETGRLASTFVGAIRAAGWCSSDPLCIEADAAGADSLNLAACHACLLLPEVSCEHANVFLDRGLLSGTPADPGLGHYAALELAN